MATLTTTITDKAGRVIEMKSAAATHALDTAFDSYLIIHENGCENHTLTLVLKVFLKQVVPTTLKLFGRRLTLPHADADDNWFRIKPWTAAEFAVFRTAFLRQCAYWTNQFWLTPPAGFTGYDYKLSGRTVRPNVYCHLYVDLVGSVAAAHRVIEVVNLDRPAAAAKLSKPVRDLDGSDFRSHAGLYDSFDTRPVPLPFDDDKGVRHTLNRSTIAHEIGHALGQDHSGTVRPAPRCEVAAAMDQNWIQQFLPAVYKGGTNSHACYGEGAAASVGANVMGYGLGFDEQNAVSWRDRIALHTKTKAADWKVVLKKKPAPKWV